MRDHPYKSPGAAAASPTIVREHRHSAWKWYVCFLLLLATMLNYMDRQTLSQLSVEIKQALALNSTQYGQIELAFGLAFAAGSIAFGFLVDRIGPYALYPIVLLAWSAAGFATAWADTFMALIVCRTLLGFFEAGQWPCALKTSQQLLSQRDRTLGNSILQSGASLGAITTPLVVQALVTAEAGSWRLPFRVIGLLGLVWIALWFLSIRRRDLAPSEAEARDTVADALEQSRESADLPRDMFVRRLIALAAVVISINLCWHFFRAWMPMFLRESHGYSRDYANYFTSLYYIASDAGCIAAGLTVAWFARHGMSVSAARKAVFLGCSMLTATSVLVAFLPTGNLLLGALLVVAFGSLGLFPVYYALAQDLSVRHQGKIVGLLGATTWVVTAVMHPIVGGIVDETQSFAAGLMLAGFAPLVGYVALQVLWDRPTDAAE